MRMLNNPRYAGAYAYGRRRYRRAVDGKKTGPAKRDCGDWLACIPNAHPGYISWEQYQENLKLLETNGRGYELARASPPREGAALLQGRAVCGRCGRHFRVRYAPATGQAGGLVCLRSRTRLLVASRTASRSPGRRSTRPSEHLIAEEMTPAAVELALEIRREIEAR